MINPRGLIVLLFAVAILFTVCVRARADDRPQLDCATVRAYVATARHRCGLCEGAGGWI